MDFCKILTSRKGLQNLIRKRKSQIIEQASLTHDLTGVIAHSDRGSQYTSGDFRGLLNGLGMVQSMNSAAGRCHDNAKCESMWARGKAEIMACYETKRLTCAELKKIIEYYYSIYWNYRRICSAIGGVPPMIKRAAYMQKMSEFGLAA